MAELIIYFAGISAAFCLGRLSGMRRIMELSADAMVGIVKDGKVVKYTTFGEVAECLERMADEEQR